MIENRICMIFLVTRNQLRRRSGPGLVGMNGEKVRQWPSKPGMLLLLLCYDRGALGSKSFLEWFLCLWGASDGHLQSHAFNFEVKRDPNHHGPSEYEWEADFTFIISSFIWLYLRLPDLFTSKIRLSFMEFP